MQLAWALISPAKGEREGKRKEGRIEENPAPFSLLPWPIIKYSAGRKRERKREREGGTGARLRIMGNNGERSGGLYQWELAWF